MHKVTRENDEYACTCGLRWGVDEEDPHCEPPDAPDTEVNHVPE